MRKFILRSRLPLGDIVLLTAAVRDLQRHFPGRYQVDVRTCFPDLWQHNPYLSSLGEYDPEVTVLDCVLPLINRSHFVACHSLHGFLDFLNQYLGTSMQPTAFRGDIHLSSWEKRAPSTVQRLAEAEIPFWLISAGGKYDCTIKWWDPRRYQEVVDHFRGRLQFVQVGDANHFHPKLRGAIDLRGVTTVRDLVRLMYHAQGVLCGVTGLMHLAAATPVRSAARPRPSTYQLSSLQPRVAGGPATRPCVVVAGGREPPHWEAYPGHQFLHTVGALPCCRHTGCWNSRTVPLGDGDERDRKENLCRNVSKGLPRCMEMISSADVIRAIECYFQGGAARFLSPVEARAAAKAVGATAGHTPSLQSLNFHTAPEAAAAFVKTIPAYPASFTGRGIVICGGGVRMFTNAWVAVRMLRRLGCSLRIQIWHAHPRELDDQMRALVAPFDVECIDAEQVRRAHPARLPHVWALKPFALLHSPFREALLLDADNVPVINPEFLFDSPQFRKAGAVFWPDYERLPRHATAWKLFDVPYRDEAAFESGQVLVNKEACWRALNLCLWYNEHREVFYKHVYGDKDTFHMAFRRLGLPYAMPGRGIRPLRGTMVQHDFAGRRLFQHRNGAKWTLFGRNPRVRGFMFERECRQFLKELRVAWYGPSLKAGLPQPVPRLKRNPQAKTKLKLFACLITEAGMGPAETLANLRATDWGQGPVYVPPGEKRFSRIEENAAHAAWRALRAGCEVGADYILYLEPDLEFNRYVLHNLRSWPVLAERRLTLASLGNPGVGEFAKITAAQAATVDPMALFGPQALLIPRRTARFLLGHWLEVTASVPSAKLRALATQLENRVFCHWPSLARPTRLSEANGTGRPARDFQRDWRATSEVELELTALGVPALQTRNL